VQIKVAFIIITAEAAVVNTLGFYNNPAKKRRESIFSSYI